MPLTSDKNKEYVLRPDISYFIISEVSPSGQEELIAQSVLVAAKEQADFDTLAIDNIEIANKAIKHQLIIAEAYEKLKKQFADKKIIIGTSYNDDGGTVTAGLSMEKIKAQPLQGNMIYSDCFAHNDAYVFNDPKVNEEKEVNKEQYFGLQNDNIERSHLRYFIDSQELQSVKEKLIKIGQGEDDGEGGMIFPDNYSSVIGTRDKFKGYVVAADYVTQGNYNKVTFEDVKLVDSLPLEDKVTILKDYFERKNFAGNDNLNQLYFSPAAVERGGEALKVAVQETFEDYYEDNESIIVNLNMSPEEWGDDEDYNDYDEEEYDEDE